LFFLSIHSLYLLLSNMRAQLLLPVASFLLAVANASPIEARSASPQWYGASHYLGDQDYCVLCEDEPDTYYVSNPLCCENGCDGGDCPCQQPQKVKTVTIRPELPTFSRYDPTSTVTIGGDATVTVIGPTITQAAATITIGGTTITVTNPGVPAAAPTQPVHNQGFNGGALTNWVVNTGTLGGNVLGSTAFGLLDFDPAVNSTTGSADFQIPLSTTLTTGFAQPALSQVVQLQATNNYILSFFVATPNSLGSLANINLPGVSSLLAGLLGLTSATGVTADLLNATPLASLAGCQITASIGGVSTQFPLYSGTAAAPTALVSLVNVNGAPTWTRFDIYFPSPGAGPQTLNFQASCPGLANALAPGVLTGVTGMLGGLLGTVTTALGLGNLGTSVLGQILGGLGATNIDILLDQVAIDLYSPGTA
jgi:hypothetical protein